MSNETPAAIDPDMFAAVFSPELGQRPSHQERAHLVYERLLGDLRGRAGPAPERSG